MPATEGLQKATASPVVVGTGFLPLDLVYRDDKPERLNAFAGGTCGNVLSILGFLGWTGYPVARHDNSQIADLIRSDLSNWNVRGDFLNLDPTVFPPVVVQRIFSRRRGMKTHSFAWNCPGCGAPLPTYKPILAKSIPEVAPRLPRASAFFFDRVSRGTLDLAKAMAEKGAVLVFEPSMIGEPKLFSEAYGISHIVKYSQERLADVREAAGTADPLLEIETLGAAGLRYKRAGSKWKEVESFQSPTMVDTSGAGDWCSAGLIHSLCQGGVRGLQKAKTADLQEALRIGQAMGAWACGFGGARSGMYGVSFDSWRQQIGQILDHEAALGECPSAPICPSLTVEICCPTVDRVDRLAALTPHSANAQICATLLQGRQNGQALRGRA